MTWVKIDDHFDEHPKLARVGPLAWGVWLAGIAYCNRNLTDGFIPWTKARTLASFDVVEDDGKVWQLSRTSGYAGEDIESDWVIGLLIDAGLWEEVANGRGRIDGYRIHDYDDYQPSKDQVLAERDGARERMRKKRSEEVRPNIAGTSERVPPKFNDPVPVPVPVPVPEPKEETGAKAPANADASPPSASLSTENQSEERRDTEGHVYALVDAFAFVTKRAPSQLQGRDRKDAAAAFRPIAKQTSVDDVAGCASFLRTDAFWKEPGKLTARKLAQTIPEWIADGRPPAIAARASPNGKAATVPTEFPDDGGLSAIRAMGQQRGDAA